MTPLFDRLDALPPLSPEERQLLDSVKALAPRTRSRRAPPNTTAAASSPGTTSRRSTRSGSTRCSCPRHMAAPGSRYAAYLACVREISAACASTGIIWATNFHATKPLIDFGTEEQKQRLLPRVAEGAIGALAITEPDAGSDATGMTTRFTPDGDDIVVSRRQDLHHQRRRRRPVSCVFGKWREIADRRGAISALVHREGHARPRGPAQGGQDRATAPPRPRRSPSTDCRVPRANLLGAPGEGLQLLLAVAQQVAAERRGARARHRPRRLRGRGRLHQRAPPVRPPHRRVPGHPVPAGRPRDRSRDVRSVAVARRGAGRRRRAGYRHRSLDAEAARLRSGDAHRHRGGAAARRLRLLQGLSGRAADARRQDHADLGRHQPDPPPADRPQLYRRGASRERANPAVAAGDCRRPEYAFVRSDRDAASTSGAVFQFAACSDHVRVPAMRRFSVFSLCFCSPPFRSSHSRRRRRRTPGAGRAGRLRAGPARLPHGRREPMVRRPRSTIRSPPARVSGPRRRPAPNCASGRKPSIWPAIPGSISPSWTSIDAADAARGPHQSSPARAWPRATRSRSTFRAAR